ncbi:hypothetical protein A6B40_00175 [Mannheimia varigena]|nr:hypothetical protein A6B40_00175 [Mannheimia varigena]
MMKSIAKTAFILTAFVSATVFAKSVPSEIYQPRGELVKADRQGNGEFEVEYRVKGNDVRSLAQQTIAHAKKKGFRVVESEIKRDDADLKFERGDQELDVQIELKGNNRIEYKADLDLDKN